MTARTGVPDSMTPDGLKPSGSHDRGKGTATTPTALEANLDTRKWGMICHLGGFAGLIIPLIGGVLCTLILWQWKKQELPFVDEQGKQAVNFQITMLAYLLIAALISAGALVLPVGIVNIVFMVIAAMKANAGEHYKYPEYLCYPVFK